MKYEISVQNRAEKYYIEFLDLEDMDEFKTKLFSAFKLTVIYLKKKYNIEHEQVYELIKKYNIFFTENININDFKFIDIKGAILYFYNQHDAQCFLENVIIPHEIIFKLSK